MQSTQDVSALGCASVGIQLRIISISTAHAAQCIAKCEGNKHRSSSKAFLRSLTWSFALQAWSAAT